MHPMEPFKDYWVTPWHVDSNGKEFQFIDIKKIFEYYPTETDHGYIASFLALHLVRCIDESGHINMTLDELHEQMPLYGKRRISKWIRTLCNDGHLIKIRRSKYKVVGWYPYPQDILDAEKEMVDDSDN